MGTDEKQSRLTGNGAPFRAHSRGLLGRLLMFTAGAVLLVAVFMASLLLFAVVLMGGLLVGGYLWWKTRDLRRQMREQMRARPTGGRVIEGDAIRDVGSDDEGRR